MNVTEKLNARSSLNQARADVFEELDYLYMEKRQNEDLIKSAEEERSRLSNNIEYWENEYARAYSQWKQSERITNQSILVMLVACAAAFIAIGYAVWVG